MAALITCPACGQNVPLPAGFGGGQVTCPNPACAQSFEPEIPVSQAASGANPVARPSLRPRGSRPELLDQLPTNFFLSAPMVAVAGVCVLLYGMVLTAVVSARRNQYEPEPEPPRNSYAFAPVDSHPSPSSESPKPTDPPKSPTAPKPPDLAGKGKTKEAKPASKGEAEKSAKPETPGKGSDQPPKKDLAVVTPRAVVAPAPAPPPPPPNESWGPLKGPPGDCEFRVEGDVLTIEIPNTLHILSPDLNVKNAPRLLTDVRGDFTALVIVSGKIRPGTQPLPNLPFTYQGAGLLLWQDENNYLRFERCSVYSPERKRLHQVFLELVRDGRVVSVTPKNATDAGLALKFDRRGSEVRCSYSPDLGKTWIEIKRQQVQFPASAKIGVSATNASVLPFAAQLENFEIARGDKSGGK